MAQTASLAGRRISHYQVIEQIGAGGMGIVYRAHDERLDRDVAFKVLPVGTLADESARKQFRREALALAKLNHPNIATIYDFDSQDGFDFLTMELIAGRPLNEKIEEGPLSERDTQSLGKQLAEGLAAAHDQGVIHRDLKPGNLFVTPDGRLKILDFGLAKLRRAESDSDLTQSFETTAGNFSGTVPYMSPEQLRGQQLDPRSDIYGAGAVLYEMATGRRPFSQRQSAELMAAILRENPPSARTANRLVSAQLDSVIAKALEKEPGRRYQSARELRVALEGLEGRTGGSRSRARLYAAGGALAALLAVGIAVTLKTRGAGGRGGAPATTDRSSGSGGAVLKNSVPTRRSVAVLGFRNTSGRPEEAWVSTALSEMLTTELAAGERLRTVSGETVARMKADLALPEADSYAADTLGKMRQTVGADYFVLGSFVPIGKPSENKVRVDLRLEDAAVGQVTAAVSASGSIEDLDALVGKAAVDLRRKLGTEDISSSQAAMLRAALPSGTEAARLYSEGLTKWRAFDLLGARDLLKKATLADPEFALAHSALAGVLSSLGYDRQAREEAKRAFELSANANRETRLVIEGLYRSTNNERGKATEIYRTLFNFFPDSMDYGLSFAEALRLGGKSKESLEVVESLKRLPEPLGDNPRIDLAEAQAAAAAGEFPRELAAGSRAEKKARDRGERILAARALGAQSRALHMTGQHQLALQAAREEQKLYAAAGDKQGRAIALGDIAQPLLSTGDHAGALKAQQEALAIVREIGSQRAIGVALNNMAINLIGMGDLNGAVRSWNEELQICKAIDDKEGVATAHGNIGGALFIAGDLRGARKSFEQALAESQAIGDKHGAADARQNLAETLALLGHLDEAERLSQQSLSAAREAGEKSAQAAILEGLGRISERRNDLPKARLRYSEALELRNAISEKGPAAESSVDLADLSIEEGRPEQAHSLLEGAKTEFQKERMADDELLADIILAKASLATGKAGEAESQLDAAQSLATHAQDRAIRLAFGIMRGRALALTGRYSEGVASLREVQREAEGAGFVGQALEARLALGEVDLASGKSKQALEELASVKAEATSKGFLLIARKATALLQHAVP